MCIIGTPPNIDTPDASLRGRQYATHSHSTGRLLLVVVSVVETLRDCRTLKEFIVITFSGTQYILFDR